MFKYKYIYIFIIVSLSMPLTTLARNGIYITLATGPVFASRIVNNNEYRTGVGYNHDLSDIIGLGFEVGTGYFPQKKQIAVRTLEFLFTNQFHFHSLDLTSKLGGIRQKLIFSYSDYTNTHIALQAGIQTAFHLTPNFAYTLEYTHIFGKTNVDEILFGARYTF